jgi:hypothetical protein
MSFVAVKVGVGVPATGFSGSVQAVFRNACILAPGDGMPVTLVPAAAGGLPGGISIETPRHFDFERSLLIGAPAAVRGGILRVAGGDFSVDLRGAKPWRSNLAALALDPRTGTVRTAWSVAREVLDVDGRGAALAEVGGDAIDDIVRAAQTFDADRAAGAMSRLVGLGAGGTPAGDDFLVGFLAALWASKGSDDRRIAFVALLSGTLRGLLERTNAVSRTYLAAASAGEVSERLTKLAVAIARGQACDRVRATAQAAIAVGHTSGADGIFGLLRGIEAWRPDMPDIRPRVAAMPIAE